VLYLTRILGLGPALVGVIFAVGSIGGLLGALLTTPLTRRIGYGPAIISGVVTLCVGALAFAAAQGPPAVVAPLLAFAWFLVAVGNVVNNINQVSVRQAMVPDRLQGRVSATMRFLAGGLVPLSRRCSSPPAIRRAGMGAGSGRTLRATGSRTARMLR